jgi:hypothetical protein
VRSTSGGLAGEQNFADYSILGHNESPVYVKDQLGHSSIQITVDIYGHLVPGANRGAVDRLAADTCCNLSTTSEEDGGKDREGTTEEDWSRGGS